MSCRERLVFILRIEEWKDLKIAQRVNFYTAYFSFFFGIFVQILGAHNERTGTADTRRSEWLGLKEEQFQQQG